MVKQGSIMNRVAFLFVYFKAPFTEILYGYNFRKKKETLGIEISIRFGGIGENKIIRRYV